MTVGLASLNRAESKAPVPPAVGREARIEEFVRHHHAFAWRCLRRLGLSPADADDAAQRVFVIATSRYGEIQPGCERAFLFRTATHVASKVRRTAARRPDRLSNGTVDDQDTGPLADELVDQRRARELLDHVLGELAPDLAAVIVLFEIEGLDTAEVAHALEIPVGTVASRLRRARAEIQKRVARHLARARTEEPRDD